MPCSCDDELQQLLGCHPTLLLLLLLLQLLLFLF
jgi:hypothetical protein